MKKKQKLTKEEREYVVARLLGYKWVQVYPPEHVNYKCTDIKKCK